MRVNLKIKRKAAGMTQQQVADHLGICLRSYKAVEAGAMVGRCAMWDKLEDLFQVHQRVLRENRPDPADSQRTR